VLIDGDIEGLYVGYSVSDGASLGIRLGGDDGMWDGLFDMTKLGIEDGFSLIVSEGAAESTSDGMALGAAGAGAMRKLKSSTSEYCTSHIPFSVHASMAYSP